MEQDDGDRLAAGFAEQPRRAAHVVRIEPYRNLAVGERPLPYLVTPGAWDQRRRLVEVEIEEVVAGLATDLQHVAKAGGRDQTDPGPLAFENAVGDECRRVDERRRLYRTRALQDRPHPVERSDAGVGGGRQGLGDAKPARIDDGDIGERPAYIYTNAVPRL